MKKLFLSCMVMALLCTASPATTNIVNFVPSNAHLARHSDDTPPLKRAHDPGVAAIVRRAAIREGVPVNFAMAIASHESGMRCNAVGSAGERGVMQIKPSTARGIGYKGSSRGLNDCYTGVYWGMKYLRMAIDKARGDLRYAAYLYNAGINAKTRNPAKKRYVLAVFSKKSLTK